MLQVGTGDKHKVVLANHLGTVAHDAAHTRGMLHEVELIDVVIVDGIGEFLLAPVGDVEHILAHQRRNLVYNPPLVHPLGHDYSLRLLRISLIF